MKRLSAPHGSLSAWAPLSIRVFRILWFAQLGSNIGTWMQTVGAQWFLVDAAASPTLVALVQTASAAPAVLFAVYAGAIADSADRRTLLIWGSIASGAVALALAAVSLVGALAPWSLLGFTFVLGMLATLTGPAWQSIQPELVPRAMIPAAAGLGSITVNGARAVGPALAGFLVAGFGVSTVFALNALSFIAAAVAVARWDRPPQEGLDDREPIPAAVRAGFRYIRSAGLVRRILLRSALFTTPASGLWALLPLVADGRLGLQSSGYGVLLAALGVGALAGVFVLPTLRLRFSDNAILAGSSLGFAVGVAGSATLPLALTLVALVVAGAAWIGTLTVLNAALQLTLPQWVRSRGGAFNIFVFGAAMAGGSFLWGLAAELVGTSATLLFTAVLLSGSALSVRWWGLREGTGTIDRSISMSWPTPTLLLMPRPTDGPVTIFVHYSVDVPKAPAFAQAMKQVERSRRRTGATRWRLLRSGEQPTAFVEAFTVASWSEHRQQETRRLTGRDQEILDAAAAYSSSPPMEEHYFPAGVRVRTEGGPGPAGT